MHPKIIEAPTTFTGRDIACIKIHFHLILTVSKLHCCTIMSFVDIFVDILDSLDRSNALDIDMTAVLPDKPFAVWYNPAVINHMTAMLKLCSSVTATKNRL